MTPCAEPLRRLLGDISACRICKDTPMGVPLPHEPRPVLRPSSTARICICSQAPGTRVHSSGKPFTDPSGDRLRSWLQVSVDEFYDDCRIAIVPMAFCFPGHDAAGGDLPPRKECARAWHKHLFAAMPQLELILLVGSYAQRWHLGAEGKGAMTDIVKRWKSLMLRGSRPRYVPLPHPSWRNNHWLVRNPWFERDLLPALRRQMRPLLAQPLPTPAAQGD